MKDLIVVGSGPGGYTAAIRAAQKGLSVLLVEKSFLGGTCLNLGCIPSKALIYESFKKHQNIDVTFQKVQSAITEGRNGLKFLMKKNKIEVIFEEAQLKQGKLYIKEKEIESKNILLAMGSKPRTFFKKSERVITSDEIFFLKTLPKSMIILGAGVIGLELAQAFSNLGTQISIIDIAEKPLIGFDKDLSQEFFKIFEKNYKFYLQQEVASLTEISNQVEVFLKNGQKLNADIVLLATGRIPLEVLELEKTSLGYVKVNQNFQTSIPNIYAIGDLIEGISLAHRAEDEGCYVAEFLAGEKPQHNTIIPSVVYTHPEIASVGLREQDIKIPFKKGIFPFKNNARSRIGSSQEGFVKVLAHKTNDEILGVHILGDQAGELISIAQLAMSYKATCEDIVRTIFPHPTLGEAFKEACSLAWENTTINM
jgi:dihydrolipoamide dehydrogenase